VARRIDADIAGFERFDVQPASTEEGLGYFGRLQRR
jgi:hypothetical protein